jgi:AbrB family looped-hinge helix DNA binding protein
VANGKWHAITAIRLREEVKRMRLAIDKFGRVVLPKPMRDDLALGPGSLLDVAEEGDSIRLRPVRSEATLKKKDGVLVFSGQAVGDLADALREQRQNRLSRAGRPRRQPR